MNMRVLQTKLKRTILKKGFLDDILGVLQSLPYQSINDIIKEDELSQVEQIQKSFQYVGFHEKPVFELKMNSNMFQGRISASVPNIFQLGRPACSIRNDKNRLRTSDQVAVEQASKHIMLESLGEARYREEMKRYYSNSDLLYGYSHKNGYTRPVIYTRRVQIDPGKSVCFIKSDLILEPGRIMLYGDSFKSYGVALMMSCKALQTVLEKLKIL